ncbi:MAG: aldo/keto reductase [Pseudomonadota bacterium]
MQLKLFGPTGLRVSELCLGTMTFGEDWGWGASKEESEKIFHAFVEAGGNFIDTANHYTNGASEQMVGEFIESDRHRFVVATKYTLTPTPDDPNAGGNHRKNMLRAVEESLQRLNTDYIDIYWVHAWDFLTSAEEVMRGLDDLVRLGKVHYVGISDVPAWYVAKANMLAELRGWTAFAGLQLQYSLIERTSERELIPYAAAHGLTTLAWSPLGGGMLTGKYGTGTERLETTDTRYAQSELGRLFLSNRAYNIAEAVKEVADEVGCTMAQVSLAWIRLQNAAMIPIIGARRLPQLKDNLASLQIDLSDEHLNRLEDASAVEKSFPIDFLANVKSVVYGETLDRIDTRRRGY